MAKKLQISSSSQATGADIREDEEQEVKFQEIIDLLVAAGYFRARIKGLSNFDKVVGGLTWCIESCNFDVDVDLLFHENLTIGQKIALTEKIVVVLPKMNCPHRIEPHQIQGLDCIHIFPVVQWLVIQSMKTREEMAEFVRAYSISQADKSFSDVWHSREVSKDLKMTEELQKPSRLYKRQVDPPSNLEMKLKSTLLEYGSIPASFSNISKEEDSTLSANDEAAGASNDESHHADLMKTMAAVEDNSSLLSASTVGNIVNIQAQEIAKVAESFAHLQTLDNQDEDIELKTLENRKANLELKLDQLNHEKEVKQSKIIEAKDKVNKIRSERKASDKIYHQFREMESGENKETLLRLRDLLAIYDGLKEQETKFREQCKIDLKQFEVENDEQKEEQVTAYEEQKELVTKLKLQLAKKNRQVALMARQLDDVPSRSELGQYQKRFLELYNQVSTKHKETKQHYTLYNTLDDTKLYLNKELSILNSIQENYKEAMGSRSKTEEFFKQLEQIVQGTSEIQMKVEKRYKEEEAKRNDLMEKLSKLKEKQRQYLTVVELFRTQCRNNEAILVQLRANTQNS